MAGLLNPLRTERSWSAEVGMHSTNRRSSRIQSNPLRRKSGGTAADCSRANRCSDTQELAPLRM
jgi:hypothetical protein